MQATGKNTGYFIFVNEYFNTLNFKKKRAEVLPKLNALLLPNH